MYVKMALLCICEWLMNGLAMQANCVQLCCLWLIRRAWSLIAISMSVFFYFSAFSANE